jgi:hypothetical protein
MDAPDRYVVLPIREAHEKQLGLHINCSRERCDFLYTRGLTELYDRTTTPWTCIADDAIEPEDCNFYRDLRWVVDLLNKLDRDRQSAAL